MTPSTWTPLKQTTFTNSWFCPQCKRLTEHTIIYKKTRTNGNKRNIRLLVCTVCNESTPVDTTTVYRDRLNARVNSKLKNGGHYFGDGRVKGWRQ